MSRSTKYIPRRLTFDPIRDVYLNKGGKKIGQIVRWRGKACYLSWRKPIHYFIIHHGFGCDRALLNNMISKDGIDIIIIEYHGKRGLKYFLSNIDDWIFHGADVGYNKDRDEDRETYGMQKILSEEYMDELVVE